VDPDAVGMVSGVGRWMGVIRWGWLSSKGKNQFWGVPYTNGDFATLLFLNYFGQYLFYLFDAFVSHPQSAFTPWDLANIFIMFLNIFIFPLLINVATL